MCYRVTLKQSFQKYIIVSQMLAGISILLAAQLCAAQATTTKSTSSARSNPNTQQSELWLSIFPARQQIYGLYDDIKDSNILYACTNRGLFKTSNSGMTWAPIYSINAISCSLAQSKSAPSVMYLGWESGRQSGVTKTTDSSNTWQQIGAQDIKDKIQEIRVDDKNPDLIYVLSESVLYKSLNGGRTWGNVTPTKTRIDAFTYAGLQPPLNFLVMDPLNSNHLLASDRRMGAGSNLGESTDGGASWQLKTSAVVSTYSNGPSSSLYKSDKWQSYWFHPTDANLRIALVNQLGADPAHLVISHNGGSSWNDISIMEKGASYGNDRAPITAFGWSLKSPGTIYAGTAKALYASADYGQQWTIILPSATSACIEDPHSGNLYAATTVGVLKSRDRGHNWYSASLGLPNSGVGDSNLFQAIQIQGQKIYVGGRGGFWMSPDEGLTWSWSSIDNTLSKGIVKQLLVLKDNTIFLNQGDFGNEAGIIHSGDREARILKLQPDGKFVQINSNRPPYTIGMSSSDPATIYMLAGEVVSQWNGLVTGGSSLMKSEDSGFSWETFNLARWLRPTVAKSEIVDFPIMTVASQSSKTVYAAISLYDRNKTYSHEYALMQTLDGGKTWRDIFPDKLIPSNRIREYGDLGDIVAITIDPRDSRIVYLAFNGGVYRSGDEGAKWTQLPIKAGKINDITVSSQSSQVLYLAAETGIWVSKNAGKTWVPSKVGPLKENVERILSIGDLTLAQGDNGIYRLTSSDLSWERHKWEERESRINVGSYETPATITQSTTDKNQNGQQPSNIKIATSTGTNESTKLAWLNGTWEGTGSQKIFFKNITWKIQLVASPNSYSILYPSLSCGGYWSLNQLGDKTASFTEHITAGKENCADNVPVVVTRLSANQLQCSWTTSGKTSTATLTLVNSGEILGK